MTLICSAWLKSAVYSESSPKWCWSNATWTDILQSIGLCMRHNRIWILCSCWQRDKIAWNNGQRSTELLLRRYSWLLVRTVIEQSKRHPKTEKICICWMVMRIQTLRLWRECPDLKLNGPSVNGYLAILTDVTFRKLKKFTLVYDNDVQMQILRPPIQGRMHGANI